MVLSGMSHVMVKLFAPWVSWKVLPYSGRIALLFVLHTVAFFIITRITVCWRCFFSSRQRNGRKYVSFSRNFLWRRRRYQFCGRGRLGCRTRYSLLLRFVFRILLNANSFGKWNRVWDNGNYENFPCSISPAPHYLLNELIFSRTEWKIRQIKEESKGDSLT